jgi:HSP20 family protein
MVGGEKNMKTFDEIFQDMDAHFKKTTERMYKEMEQIAKAVQTGKLQGKWNVTPIDKPGIKGYIVRGYFRSNEQPLISKHAITEKREPLTDVFEDENQVKLYLELPGVEKEDIRLDIINGQAEVKAKNFYKLIDLPTKEVEDKKVSANYKNGVLEVIVPKNKKKTKEKKKENVKID